MSIYALNEKLSVALRGRRGYRLMTEGMKEALWKHYLNALMGKIPADVIGRIITDLNEPDDFDVITVKEVIESAQETSGTGVAEQVKEILLSDGFSEKFSRRGYRGRRRRNEEDTTVNSSFLRKELKTYNLNLRDIELAEKELGVSGDDMVDTAKMYYQLTTHITDDEDLANLNKCYDHNDLKKGKNHYGESSRRGYRGRRRRNEGNNSCLWGELWPQLEKAGVKTYDLVAIHQSLGKPAESEKVYEIDVFDVLAGQFEDEDKAQMLIRQTSLY
jgi:hypothetical protein